MNVILTNMSNWCDWPPRGALVNRNYHICQRIERHLVGEDNLIMIDFLPFNRKRQIKNAFNQLRMARHKVVGHGWGYQIYLVGKKRFVVLSWINGKNYRLQNKLWEQIKRFAENQSRDQWMLWGYHPGFSAPFEDQWFAKKIFDVVDDWRTHDIHLSSRAFLDESYKKIISRADVVFSVSEGAKNSVAAGHQNSHWMPNGVEIEHYAQVMPRKQKPIRLGYVGIIENRLDYHLIDEMARNHLDWEFVLVGKVFPNFKGKYLSERPNVKFLGQVPYQNLPEIMETFNVGIVPHKINEFTASMNPLKLYEYLSAGLPCVSTPVAGSEQFGKFVEIARNKEEFVAAIDRLTTSYSLDEIHARKNFVRKYSWDNRFKEMKKWISQ